MKFYYFLITCLFLSCSTPDKQSSLSGWWSDSASSNFTNCYAQFQVKDDSIIMTHFIEFNGQSFFETGKGIISGDSLIYNVTVRHGIPGWSTAGIHRLKIIDRNTLSGNYLDNKGNTGPLVFKKKIK